MKSTSHIYSCGEPFEYTAVTGTLPTADKELEIFFIGYFKDSNIQRPITFVFPGGPGGACGPDAICSFGPRRVLTPQEGNTILPPYKIIDNPESLLPWTDLVFVDPAGTGFSTQELSLEQMTEYYDVEGDIRSLGNFVKNFISYFNRWDSPKYLSGISYGSTRSAGIAEYLTYRGLSIHGIMLLGSAIDFSTLIGQHNRFLPDSLLIPTFAATAWYHNRLNPNLSLSEVVFNAKSFVFDTYIPAMLQPNKYLDDAFYEKLSSVIGLSVNVVKRFQGRFDETLFTKEFFGDERKVIGGLDSRFIGEVGSKWNIDPSNLSMQGIYCAFNSYLQNELETSMPFEEYLDFSHQANQYWNYSTYDSVEFPEFIQRIHRTLLMNPEMKVFVGSGYYDCRTPFAATDYCFNHLGLPTSYSKNIQFEYFEAGHGFVFDLPCLQKLKKDLVGMFPEVKSEIPHSTDKPSSQKPSSNKRSKQLKRSRSSY